MANTATCKITVDPERDSDNLIVWRCACGVWGTDYDEDEVQTSINMHADGLDSTR